MMAPLQVQAEVRATATTVNQRREKRVDATRTEATT